MIRKKLVVLFVACLLWVGCKPDLIRKGSPTTAPSFQLENVYHVVKKVKQHFPNVALPHLGVSYNYSILRNTQSLGVFSLSFFLPHGKTSSKTVKAKVRALMRDLGHKDLSCLNVFINSTRRRFVSYNTILQEVKVSFACG